MTVKITREIDVSTSPEKNKFCLSNSLFFWFGLLQIENINVQYTHLYHCLQIFRFHVNHEKGFVVGSCFE